MTALDVTALTASLDGAVIVAGVIALGAVKFGPSIARWGIAQVKRMFP